MKKLLVFLTGMICLGCSYNSNQKLTSPFLGSVKNEYYIINIKVEDENGLNNVLTNISRIARSVKSENGKETKQARFSLGKGTEVFALDNQVLIGHDFGNTSSNSVDGTLSVPLSL